MNTANRKQREMEQREAQILEVARKMLVDGGYHGLSMDRIAEAVEYSKGTIYNHFSNKEDILIALANETQTKRVDLFHRAAAFKGRSRERLAAIAVAAELFVLLYPDHFAVEQTIRQNSFWEKTSEERRRVMRGCETRCVGVVGGVVRDGLAHGDLELPENVTPEELVFGLWAMNYGAFTIATSSESLEELGIRNPISALHQNMATLLDGYGWRPLSTEHDYEQVVARIQHEVFPDEHRIAQAG